jgi:hypothetical protein
MQLSLDFPTGHGEPGFIEQRVGTKDGGEKMHVRVAFQTRISPAGIPFH